MSVNVEQVIREYIDKTVHLSLATTSNNAPWVCEVHFAYDDKLNVYFRSLKSKRHSQEIADNSNVAGSIIDTYSLDDAPVGVYFEGKAELLEPGEEQNIGAECLIGRLNISNDIVEDASHDHGHQIYRISVANWYVFGRFGGPSGQKHKLEWNGGTK